MPSHPAFVAQGLGLYASMDVGCLQGRGWELSVVNTAGCRGMSVLSGKVESEWHTVVSTAVSW